MIVLTWNYRKKGVGIKQPLIFKKIRNRIPDKFIDVVKNYVLPYSGIFIIALFSLIINYAHAEQTQTAVVATSDDVMNLSPIEVANVVNNLNPYTPNIKADSVSVALAMENTDYIDKPIITDTAITTVAQSPTSTNTTTNTGNRTATVSYTVQDGDTLSNIGWKYGLKIATIKTVNNITTDNIKPGQTLKLPPGDISQAAIAAAQAKLKKVAGASTKKTVSSKAGSSVNGYPWGWCTYYVATRRYVPPHWGNASSWLSSARSAGYSTGSTPVAGAIVVTSESWMGHVAYVESVSGDSFTISEMNAKGFGIISSRTLSTGDGRIRGFIY